MQISSRVKDSLLKQPAHPAKLPQVSSLEIAQRNERNVLHLLRQFGHLRIPEIARGGWPNNSFGEQMALRTLKRMEEQGDIIRRKNSLGGSSFVLSSGGAKKLEVLGYPCRHGRDIVGVAGATFFHRTLATRYLIEKLLQGYAVFGEYALAHGQAPITLEKLADVIGKVPDGIVVRAVTTPAGKKQRLVDILETEMSAKPMEELKKVLRVALRRKALLDDEYAVIVNQLYILFDESQNHARRILRAAEEVWTDRNITNPGELESNIILVPATLGFPLQWQGYREISLRDYRKSMKKPEKAEIARPQLQERLYTR